MISQLLRTKLLSWLLEMLSCSGIPKLLRKITSGKLQKFDTHINYRSKRNGYCMASSNYNSGLIACAEYGLNPEMHIYKVPGKELKHKFAMDTTVKCIALAFSRCSKYLLMIGGVPDFQISIFDLENNKKLVIPETKLPCKPEEFI